MCFFVRFLLPSSPAPEDGRPCCAAPRLNDALCLQAGEITCFLAMRSWEIKEVASKRQPSTAHSLTFPSFLNGCKVPPTSPESKVFERFLASISESYYTWRSEWTVSGDDRFVPLGSVGCAVLSMRAPSRVSWGPKGHELASYLEDKFRKRAVLAMAN